jgi:hypothetical protein
MSQPITPKEALQNFSPLPPEVYDSFNELIQKALNGNRAVVYQNEAADLVCSKLGISRRELFDRRLLDVEQSYRAAGWKVEYDKPGYNESYEATFTFVINT